MKRVCALAVFAWIALIGGAAPASAATQRYQVVTAEWYDQARGESLPVTLLVDTETGRTWKLSSGLAWEPVGMDCARIVRKAEAGAAPEVKPGDPCPGCDVRNPMEPRRPLDFPPP